MSVSIDPTLRIRPSQRVLKLLESCDKDGMPKALQDVAADSELELPDLQWLLKYKQERAAATETPEEDGLHFYELLSECTVILPEPKQAPRNPELEARIQRLKREQESREYRQMVKNIDVSRPAKIIEEEAIGKQIKELNSYLILIFQFVASIIAAFAFGYFSPYLLYGNTEVGRRLIFGLICAFVVGIADLYFIMRSFLEEEGVISLRERYKKAQ